MKKLRLYTVAALAMLGVVPSLAFAATQTATVDVNLVAIAPAGSITVNGPIDFGTVIVADSTLTAGTTFDVTVSNNVPYTITFDAGLHISATSGNLRNMMSNTGALGYYMTGLGASTWDIGVPVNGTGTGIADSFPINANVTFGAGLTPGSYSDTITITLAY